ncbi:MAG: serine/threonine-protein kinase [Kofleriaceae bacterium]
MNEGTLVGAYQIVRRIGAGGMGEVWEARHSLLGRRAAIKVLHASFSAQAEVVTRFFNEARAATAISDPGIVQIFDFGHHTDGSAYIVMEMLQGETLEHRLRRGGPLAPHDALRLIRQAASSLATAHAHGIVHRDLKPENLFVVADAEVAGGDRIKIVDFGIAKLVGDSTIKTQTSAIMGTPLFMSPEQCRGAGQVEQSSDIYSLGCVLLTLLTGQPPFVGEGVGDIIAMHLREPPPPPSSRVAGIAPAIDQLVLRCLAKDASQRPTAQELATMIGDLLGTRVSGRVERLPTGPLGALTMPPGAATTLSSAAAMSTHPPPRGSSAPIYAIIGILLVGLLGTGTYLGLRSDAPASAAAPTPAPPQPVVEPAPVPPPEPRRPEPRELLAEQLRGALAAFASWAQEHPGAPCPDASALGLTPDPWGHDLRITCGDQPADQMMGAVSMGADGRAGTDDDVASWTMDRATTELVRGPRWAAEEPRRRSSRSSSRTTSTSRTTTTQPARPPHDKTATDKAPPPRRATPRLDTDGDGIPDIR